MENNKLKSVIVTIDTVKKEMELEDRLKTIIDKTIEKELGTSNFEYTLNITYEMKGK